MSRAGMTQNANYRSHPATETSTPVQRPVHYHAEEKANPRQKKIFDDDDYEGVQPMSGLTPRLINGGVSFNSGAPQLVHTTSTPANVSPQQWENRVAQAMSSSQTGLQPSQNNFFNSGHSGTNQFSEAMNPNSPKLISRQQPPSPVQSQGSNLGPQSSRMTPQNFQKGHSMSAIPYPGGLNNLKPTLSQPRPSPYQNPGSPADVARLERDLKALKDQQARKEAELAELEAIVGINCQPLVSRSLLTQCIDAHKQLKSQEAELNDLKINYNLLKEETEKQRNELARLESGEDLDRIPRTRAELIAQNELFKQKITQLNQEYEKAVYDKTLEIERKSRCKMHQIAMNIAIEHIDAQDHEMQSLVAKVRALEAENKRLEENKSLNTSMI